jgi:hypothetical protein
MFWLWLLAIILPTLMIWNHIGFYLDNLLFPRWKETIVKNPLFLIGNARSGTTWLHRVITESDVKTFTTFKTWEMLFAVSITWRVLFHLLYILDQRICFGLWLKMVNTLEYILVGNIAIHPIGFEKAEEDEWLMIHIGLAQLLLFFFPSSSEMMNSLILFDYHADMLQAIRESATADLPHPQPPTPPNNHNKNEYFPRSRSNSFATTGLSTTGAPPAVAGGASSFASMSMQGNNTSSTTTGSQDAKHQSLLQTFFYISQQERGKGNMLSLAHRFGIFNYYKECVQRHLYFHAFVRKHFDHNNNSTSVMTLLKRLPLQMFKQLPLTSKLSSSWFSSSSSSSSSSTLSRMNNQREFATSGVGVGATNNNNNNKGLMPSLIFVSKNPAFTLRIPTIYATFPDAKIVCLLRDPLQSVPSMVSYISHVWHVFNNPKEKFPNAEELLGFCEAHYLFPLLHLHSSVKPSCQWAFLSYHACRENLKYHVLSMLSRLFDSQQFLRMTNDTIAMSLTKEQMNTSKFFRYF